MSKQQPDLPPSYDELYQANVNLPGSTVSPHQGGPQQVAVGVPRLMFVDFLPRCIRTGNRVGKLQPSFEQFRSTCLLANQWLGAHPDCRLLSVEEVDRPITWDGSYVLDKTITLHPAGDVHMVLRGLRLWVRPRFPNDTAPPQQLDYFNYLPQYDRSPGGGGQSGGLNMTLFGVTASTSLFGSSRGEYLNLDDTIQMLNSQLAHQPLPGEILSVRTVQLPLGKVSYSEVQVSEGMADKSVLNMASTCTTYFNYLRVYYIRGQPQQQQIEVGMLDFLPKMISSGGGKNPKFEPFSALTQHASLWVKDNHGMGMRITNFQTIDHVLDMHPNLSDSSINSRKTRINLTDLGLHTQRLHVRFLRVNYVRPSTAPVTPLLLSTRTVPPVQLGVKDTETTGQTVHRINHWVNASGAHVFGVESLEETYHDYTGRFDLDTAFYITSNKSRHTITAIRLFINGTYFQVMENVEIQPGPGATKRSSSTCTVM